LLFVICFGFRISNFEFVVASAHAAEPQASPPADARDVVRANMASVGGATSAESQRLQEAIERIRATKIAPRREWPVTSPPAPPRDTDGVDDPRDPSPTTRPVFSRAADALTTEQLAALRTLKGLPAAEAGLIGAALTKAGHLAEAFEFFEQAMQSSTGAEQAYFLLQMAHCRRADDPAAAQTLYRRVATEFTDTPWAPLAGAYDSALEFTRLHRPQDVIRDATSESPNVIKLPSSAKPAPAGAAARRPAGGGR